MATVEIDKLELDVQWYRKLWNDGKYKVVSEIRRELAATREALKSSERKLKRQTPKFDLQERQKARLVEELQCAICHATMEDAVALTECGHIFCLAVSRRGSTYSTRRT